MDTSMIYDVIIIGSGPAGLSAAIYAKRAQLSVLVIEKNAVSGGQVLNTGEVDNYLGLPGINGYEMGMKFREHADSMEIEFVTDTVQCIREQGREKKIITADREYLASTVILAMGAGHRKLGIEGEERLSGKGVSYCAVCDGAFFRGKTVAVVGGGDAAVENAIFLSRICEKVYVIHRRDTFRAAKSLTAKLMQAENIEVLWDSVVEQIEGEEKVESIRIRSHKTEETKNLLVDGIFIAVGTMPNSEICKDFVTLDSAGYIIADEEGKTDKPGVFAAGDIRRKGFPQIITAAADGANALNSAEKWLVSLSGEEA